MRIRRLLFKYHRLAVLSFILIFNLVITGHGGTWRDNFDGEKLKGWTRPAADAGNPWKAFWKPKDGRLDVTFDIPRGIQIPPGLEPKFVADFLQLTAFPIRGNRFSVTSTFRVREIRIGQFGLALGKLSPRGKWGYGAFYVFTTLTVVRSTRLDKTGEMRLFKLLNPQTHFVKEQIKVVFNNGHFEVYHDGILVTEFEDADFKKIEMVGFWAQGFDPFHGVADDFEISGPDIPLAVHSQGKLATTWGGLKRGLSR